MEDNRKDTAPQMEFKTLAAPIEVKGETDGILHVKAYALAFGNVDSWGDIIVPTACDEFLRSEEADRMAFCWQHMREVVIGKITSKGVDDYGMWIEADVLPTSAGKDAAILLKSGAVKEFSIGYYATKYHYEKKADYEEPVRVLDEIIVRECSPVTHAANPKAVVTSVKKEDQTEDQKADAAIDNQTQNNMTPEEIKAMRESIEAAEAKAAAEVKAAEEKLAAAQERIEAQEKSIDNLDASIKALQKTIDEVKKPETKKTFIEAFMAAIEGRKEDINALLERKSGSLRIDFKAQTITTGDLTVSAYGAQLEPGVSSARLLANAFYNNFVKETVNAERVNWLEGSFSDAADYVSELTAAADDDVTVVEKSRNFGKIAAHLRVSSEVSNFFEEVYNWAKNTAMAKILEKIDTEIYSGAGSDASYPKKIYGLKGAATAFSALATYGSSPTIADVILDAQMQALANGYTIDKAYVTFAELATIRGLKDTTGAPLYDRITGMLGAVKIVPSSKLSANELLMVDSSVVKIKERPTYEFEIVRNAELDGWDVYVRKVAQVVVKSADKKGLVYVASLSTAITAITES